VTADRIRGAVLYAGAVLLLVVGTLWWLRAKPRELVDPSIARWTAAAKGLLPEAPDLEASDTLQLGAGVDRQISAHVDDGSHHIEVVCVGGANSLVRVSLGSENDSGRGLDCTVARPVGFDVGLAGGLRMNLSVGGTSPVIFRYTVTKATD
jgi:Family of unknown function (DUF6023)